MKKYWIYLLLFLFSTFSFSQSSREKLDSIANDFHVVSLQKDKSSIYINTSKGIYETNEDLWFKATLLNEHTLLPYYGDQTLYVQLRNLQNDSIAFQSKYKIENGFSAGQIFLQNAKPGEYFLEAFSKSSFKNKEREYIGIRKIIIVENILNFKSTSKSKDEIPGLADFQLLPEGGHLVHGFISKIAFKAVDSTGNPVEVSGTILENGEPIQAFQTTHSGMGSFVLTPNYKSVYSVRLDNSEEIHTNIAFPEIKRSGITFQVINNQKEQLDLLINSNVRPQQIFIRIQSRGIIQSLATGYLKDSLKLQLSTAKFPQGVHEITLLDEDLRPVAARLVYINWNKKLNISAQLSKKQFGKKEKVTLKIKVADLNGEPVKSHLSLSVFDHQYDHPQDGKNILTHYHLSEALKGKVYNPNYYFEDESKAADLDLLLLTQGWRKYKWHEENLDNTKREHILQDGISGRIVYKNPEETKREQKAIMIFDPIDNENYFETLDSLGRFYVEASYLDLGKQFYIKHFDSNNGDKPFVRISNEFQKIESSEYVKKYPLVPNTGSSENFPDTVINPYGDQLQEVQLTGKGSDQYQYSNKYIRKLDSLANIRITSDYIGVPCGTFNCQIHHFDQSKKPIPGKTYEKMIGFKWVDESSGSYRIQGHKKFVYEKTEYTEEELMRKFNFSKVDGYVPTVEFYSPNYELEDSNFSDYRNTLIWDPLIETDNNGEYEINFYTSDFSSKFLVVIEGVSTTGKLGRFDTEFLVF